MFDNKKLDSEWVELFLYAIELGISPDEIREFFNKQDSS